MDESKINYNYDTMFNVMAAIKDNMACKIEDILDDSDLIIFNARIESASYEMFEHVLRDTFRKSTRKTDKLCIILNTVGGDWDKVPCMVALIRDNGNYKTVRFVVHEKALSAGTLFCLSGDIIYMNNASYLGALDLQIDRNRKSITFQYIEEQVKSIKNENIKQEILNAEGFRDDIGAMEDIKRIATKYLTKYQSAGKNDNDKAKLLQIPYILTDNELMKANGIESHEFPIGIELARILGLTVINYELDIIGLYDKINKLYDVMTAEILSKQLYKIPASMEFIYSRYSNNNNIALVPLNNETAITEIKTNSSGRSKYRGAQKCFMMPNGEYVPLN